MRQQISLVVLLLAIWCAVAAAQETIPNTQAQTAGAASTTDDGAASNAVSFPSVPRAKARKFNWTGALSQTGLFLGVEHALNMRYYLDIPHDHFWSRYADSVRGYHFDRWNDGNHLVTNYVGHPFSGAVVGYIFVQNSPAAQVPESAGQYWKSRLKATAWATAYSFEWELGPASESSFGNYGIYPYRDAKNRVVNSTGLVDLVITPVGGLGWMVAEDWLDRRFLEGRDHRGKFLLCVGMNPARSVANAMRFKQPCYRERQ